MKPEEALKLLPLRPKSPERVRLEKAVGRFILESVEVPRDEPPLDMSEKDGYAIRFDDLPGPFTLVGEAGPGERPERPIGRKECTLSLTGSYLPAGADTLVPKELADVVNGVVHVKGKVKRGQNVAKKGSDFRKGDVLAAKGTYITPQMAAMLRFFGVEEVKVAPKLSIGFLSIGTELNKGLVRTVNSFTLRLLAEAAGLKAVDLGTAPDDLEEISRRVKDAVSKFDIVVTTGGSSVGKRDFTHKALVKAGGSLAFRGLETKPGRTTSAYILDGKPVFLLAGVFQAALAGFLLVVLPYSLAARGLPPRLPSVRARLGKEVEAKTKMMVWAKLTKEGVAIPLESRPLKRSHLTRANCFFLLEGKMKEGKVVEVYLPPGLFSSFTLIEWAEQDMQGS